MRLFGWSTLLLLIAVTTPDAWAKNCKKGQPCGNSCISWSKTCRIGGSSYSYTPPAPAARSLYSPSKSGETPTSAAPKTLEQSSKKVDVVPNDNASETLFAQTDAAFVYELPSRSARRIRRLEFGEPVSVYETLGEWSRISPATAAEEWVQGIYLGNHAP